MAYTLLLLLLMCHYSTKKVWILIIRSGQIHGTSSFLITVKSVKRSSRHVLQCHVMRHIGACFKEKRTKKWSHWTACRSSFGGVCLTLLIWSSSSDSLSIFAKADSLYSYSVGNWSLSSVHFEPSTFRDLALNRLRVTGCPYAESWTRNPISSNANYNYSEHP
jgi:hypothetical protein